MNKFPSNSQKIMNETNKVVEKVSDTVSKATKYNGKSFGEHLWDDILIPQAKRTLYMGGCQVMNELKNSGMQILSSLLFGTNTPPAGTTNGIQNGGTAYNMISSVRNNIVPASSTPVTTTNTQTTQRATYSDADSYVRNLLFESSMDANGVVMKFLDTASTYGAVSVNTLYDMAGKTAPNLILNNWGWKVEALRSFNVHVAMDMGTGAYFIVLPKAERI